MKKTNVALLQNVRLLRVLTLVIALFVVSATQLSAQSFLPLDDAGQAVKQAVQDRQEEFANIEVLAMTPSEISPNTLQSVYSWQYLSAYLQKVDELQDVEGALDEMDRVYSSVKTQGQERDLIISARDELIDLITE